MNNLQKLFRVILSVSRLQVFSVGICIEEFLGHLFHYLETESDWILYIFKHNVFFCRLQMYVSATEHSLSQVHLNPNVLTMTDRNCHYILLEDTCNLMDVPVGNDVSGAENSTDPE